jgi:hypothetical protein
MKPISQFPKTLLDSALGSQGSTCTMRSSDWKKRTS